VGQLLQLPEPGQLVDVRRRRYVVIDITASTLPATDLTAYAQVQNLVTLSSVEDDALGEELQVIWEIEPGATLIEKTPLPDPSHGFDPPHLLDTFLHAVRWGAASSADVKALQAPFRSGVDLEDYQLDPVARAIEMPRVNLLIADDVGLGKTIEAGLVAQEMVIRHRARRMLIVCPAALQIQWREQMRDKFGLEFRIIDSKAIQELRRTRGLNVNPWSHFPRLITSIDFLKRERPLRLLREILPKEGEPLYPRKFDLLILDEAHNVAPSGRGRYATDSQRTRTLRTIAPHFEHKLFLSATPHNGYRESFTALLELLDDQRFARGVDPDETQLRAIMVRRLKSHFLNWDGSSRFARRQIVPLEVAYTAEERQVHQWLQQYSQRRITQSKDTDDTVEQYATEFVVMLLKKRLFSSPAAFCKTLEQHQRSLNEKQRHTSVTRRPPIGILRSKIEQVEEEHDDDATLDEATSEALEASAPLFRPPNAEEQHLLEKMQTWAEQARYHTDSKANALMRWLQHTLKPGGYWSDARVIIFTEYRNTRKWLYEILAREGFTERGPDGEPRTLQLFGGMESKEREEIKAAFQADPADSAVRILLATDAASEGIDLQNHCSHLIHYEIPWNPNRLEQRNGRIDRHGQRASLVNIYHFVSSRYHQQQTQPDQSPLEDDLEFLRTVVDKIDKIREDLGNVGSVIATQVEEAMLGRRRRLDTQKAEENAPSRRLQAFTRKQQKQLEERVKQLYQQLQDSKHELALSPYNVHAVVETALRLAGQPPLQPRTLEDPHGNYPSIEVFDVPHLSGSWSVCTAGLEHPHTRRQRPIVFDHALAHGRDDVVLAHLNHRLVAMSLRLLRAEVWANQNQSRLHRVTARTVPSHALDTPVVIVHARLLILGGDNQRLHEELITAGGYLREGRCVPMKGDKIRDLLALAQDQMPPEQIQRSLVINWEQHRPVLVHALEAEMHKRARDLQKKLADRSAKEQQDIRTILTELKTNIERELKQPEVIQLTLSGFSEDERNQAKRDVAALAERVGKIDAEIEQEVMRIEQRFARPQPRLFPVSVMYVVPGHLQ
jgi:ERCC4-related helicase